MILNISYDASVNNAPAGFTTAFNSVVSFFQSAFADAVTVNIAVGYGEINGQALDAGALGESLTYLNSYSYSQIKTALSADAKSADDASAVASLPLGDPIGGHYWVPTAQAKALGLAMNNGSLDGYVGFRSGSPIFDYDNSNGVTPGQYDFFGVVAHEVSEIMGRQLLVGEQIGNIPNGYVPMDLFHFASAGTRTFSGAQAGYYSPDNGVTNLGNFNTNSAGDFGDWATGSGSDAFLAFGNSGVLAPVTQNDVRVMDVLGWDRSNLSADMSPPTLLMMSPADNSANVAVQANLVLTFNENVAAGSGNVVVHNSSNGSIVTSIAITDGGRVSFSGSTVTINPSSDLSFGTHYYVTITSGAIQDLSGNAFAGMSSGTDFDFTTILQPTATKVAYDFNADGFSDILWQSDGGQAGVWLMSGSTVIANPSIGANPGTSWHIKGAADFNGDGKSDVLWQNDSGQSGIWLMDGATVIANPTVGNNPDPSWRIKGTGDFDDNGKSDILWQKDDGQAGIWLIDGSTIMANPIVGSNPGSSWHIKGTGDFNGDGKFDVLWQNDDGQAGIWLMNGSSLLANPIVGANPGPSWHIKGAGDFNGDGKSDILWQNDNGRAGAWLMNGSTILTNPTIGTNSDPSWHIKGTSDLNGDGKSDILWQNDGGQAAVWLMDGTALLGGDILTDNPGTSWHMDWA